MYASRLLRRALATVAAVGALAPVLTLAPVATPAASAATPSPPGECSIWFSDLDGNGLWSNPANWSTGALPAAEDVVCIDDDLAVADTTATIRQLRGSGSVRVVDGQLTLAQASDIRDVQLAGGVLRVLEALAPNTFIQEGGELLGAGELAVSGGFAWSGGTQSDPAGLTTVAAGAQALFTAGDLAWRGRQLEIDAEVRVEGPATIDFASSPVLLQSARFVGGHVSVVGSENVTIRSALVESTLELAAGTPIDGAWSLGPEANLTVNDATIGGSIHVSEGATLIVASSAPASGDDGSAGTSTITAAGDVRGDGSVWVVDGARLVDAGIFDVDDLLLEGDAVFETNANADSIETTGWLVLAEDVTLGFDSIAMNGGLAEVPAGASLGSPDSTVRIGVGGVALDGRIPGSVVQDGGHLAVGPGATIDGDYTQAGGSLQVVVDDALPTLSVGGAATLQGQLDLSIDHALHGRGPLVTASSLSGPFAVENVDEVSCSQIDWEPTAAVLRSVYCPTVPPLTISESNGLAAFTVAIDAPIDEPYAFEWETAAGTAVAGSDFVSASGTGVIQPGDTSTAVEIALVDDDDAEDDESFTLAVYGPTDTATATGSATIVDDENRVGFDQWFVVDDLGMLGSAMVPTGISSDQVVGWYANDTEYDYSWMYDLDTGAIGSVPGMVLGAVSDVNDAGQILHGDAIRDRDGMIHALPAVPGLPWRGGFDLNDAGEVAGLGYPTRDSAVLVRWDADGTPTVLSAPTSTDYDVREMNNEGVIVGAVTLPDSVWSRAFRYDDSGFHLLPTPDGLDGSIATAVNDDGTAVGYVFHVASDPSSGPWTLHAVTWDADGTLTDLGPGIANDINDRGVIVGWIPNPTGIPAGSTAVLWWHGASYELNDRVPDDDAWSYTDAQLINDDGAIVGRAIVGGQSIREFVLRPYDCFICLRTSFTEPSVVAPDQWQPIEGSTFEGNPVKLSVEVSNASSTEQVVDVIVYDALTEEPVDGEIHTLTLAPRGGRHTLELPIDTDGMAWSNGTPSGPREFEVQVFESGAESGEAAEQLADSIVALTVDPRPIVLVHGLWSDESTWAEYAAFAKAAHPRWKVFAVDTMDTKSNVPKIIAENAGELTHFVTNVRQSENAWSVDLVGHSMGGLISRWYIQQTMPTYAQDETRQHVPAVHRLVMLGTPNAGSPCAWLAPTPATYELRPDVAADFNAQITERRGVEFSIAAGYHVPFTCLTATPGDDVVPISSAVLGMQDVFHVDGMPHTSMTTSASLFNDFVLPRLNGTAIVVAATARGFAGEAAAGESVMTDAAPAATGDLQPLYIDALTIAAGTTERVGLNVPSGATDVGATFVVADGIGAELVDAAGMIRATVDPAGSGEVGFRTLRAPATPGRWVLRITNSTDADVDVPVGVGVLGIAVDLTADAQQVHWSGRVQVTATLASTAITRPASLVGELIAADGNVEAVTLFDDGTHGDGAAGDGRYGALVADVPSGPALVTVAITAPGFQRAASAGVLVSVSDTPPPNRAPTADPQTVLVGRDTEQRITLTGTDLDGDDLTVTAVGAPSHGTVSGIVPNITYMPAPGYRGTDSFTFTVSDGQATSAPGTITIEVGAAPVEIRYDGPFPASAAEGQRVTLRARLLDPTLAPVANMPVTFELDGQRWTATSSITGFTGVDVVITAAPGPHELRISTPASDDYRAAEIVQSFTVIANNPPAPALDVKYGNEAGYAVRFVATPGDPDHNEVSAEWDFDGDGTVDLTTGIDRAPDRAVADHVFPTAYSGTVSVTVIDSLGRRGTAHMDVDIDPYRPLGSLSRLTANAGAIEALGWDEAGRNVLFVEPVPGSANPVRERLAVLDRTTGEPQIASIDVHGNPVDTVTGRISPDGRSVVFVALSDAHVAQVYLRDLDTGITTLVSGTAAGAEGNRRSAPLAISRDAAFVLFASEATNLGGPSCTDCDLGYVWERATGAITAVSIDGAGRPVDIGNQFGDINADGRYVAFVGQVGSNEQLFVRDLSTGITTMASVTPAGTAGNGDSGIGQFDADGSVIVFGSSASDLVAGDTNSRPDVFVRDLVTGVTRSVSSMHAAADASSSGGSINADGTLVVFGSHASNLVDGDTNQQDDVFLADVLTGTVERISIEPRDGLEAAGNSWIPNGGHWLACDGSEALFLSEASNLVPGDVATELDAFVDDTGISRSCVPNRAPTVVDLSVDTNEDTGITVAVEATDPDGDDLVLEVVGGPAHGTLSGPPSIDAITYVPAANWSGDDHITVRVADPDGLQSGVATITFTVAPVNDAPVCAATQATTTAGVEITITPTCSDIDGDSLTLALGTLPAGVTGSVVGGTLRLVAAAAGTYAVPFSAQDGSLSSASVNATVVVSPAPSTAAVQYSLRSDRSAPKPLHGATVSGVVYGFWPVAAGEQLDRVEFRLDGKVFSIETLLSFDLARTAPDGTAYGLDTTLLGNGQHTVQATVVRPGVPAQVSSATFTVANGANAKQLMVSKNANRSAAGPLAGASLASSVNSYVFVSPTSTVQGAVAVFYLDGKKVSEDKLAPYDLRGTMTNGSAEPWKPGLLAVGKHTITVEFRLPSDVVVSQSATFTVTR